MGRDMNNGGHEIALFMRVRFPDSNGWSSSRHGVVKGF